MHFSYMVPRHLLFQGDVYKRQGYHRAAIDFTLHTIVEESCEESEVETEKNRQTELEKYFVYNIGLGDGTNDDQREVDTMSETSSIYSEGLESLGGGNGEPVSYTHLDVYKRQI